MSRLSPLWRLVRSTLKPGVHVGDQLRRVARSGEPEQAGGELDQIVGQRLGHHRRSVPFTVSVACGVRHR